MLVQDDHQGEEITGTTNFDELQEEEVDEVAVLSINYVVGLSTPRTKKIKGNIDQREAIVMIDCGATLNFISTKLVYKLALPLEATTGYEVLMGTSMGVKGEGSFRRVTLTLQNIEIVEDFLP